MFLIVFLLAAGLAVAQPADLLLENARIYTLNPRQPSASALAVKDGKILAVGSDLKAHLGPATRRIDAQGRALIPGLIDSHVHLRGLGSLLESSDLRYVKSVAEIAAYARRQAAQTPTGEWVSGRNWDQTNWGGQFPTAADLDQAAPDHPVYLTRVDGHAAWVNSKALQLAGVGASTPDPPGGKIHRDAQGRPTGIFIDRAMGLVRNRIPPITAAQVKRQLALAARECARLGLTSVHDAGVGRQDLDAYRQLIAADQLPVRVYAMIGGPGELWNSYLERGPEIGDRLTVRCIKLVADGALGSRGAALWQPYSDDKSNSGLLITSREQIERVARQAVEKGFQVASHAIGDQANRTVLDAYAAVLAGPNDRRFRVEHAQIVSLPDFELFRRFSIIASVQATHATSDMRWAEQRLGPDRIQGAYAWRRFLKPGIPLANGSDFPVEEPDPIPGFYASVTRQDRSGQPPGGWTPTQVLSRAEALHSWTLGGAYAAFQEQTKGSLEPGKAADFVLLSRDIMRVPAREILDAKVVLTVLGGRIVHQLP
jgi:hypothetical protein